MKFDPLFLSPQWLQEYNTKYPHGMSVLENIIEWIHQVNELIEWANVTPEKVQQILTTWNEDGTLNFIINAALQTQIDDVEEMVKERALKDITTSIGEKHNLSIFAPRNIPQIKFAQYENYVLDTIFYVPDNDNMQGITYYDGLFYVGFDMGGGNGIIRSYYPTGIKAGETSLLPLGHCADLAYHHASGNIYVATGGGAEPTFVNVVNFGSSLIVQTFDFSSKGNSGLVAVNNMNNTMVLHTAANDGAAPHFTLYNMSDMSVIREFDIPNQGTPQGLESINEEIYLYTDNKITVIDFMGNIVTSFIVSKRFESEGITFAGDYATPYIAVGYNSPNRIYALRTFENDKMTSLKPLHSMNLATNKASLRSRFVNTGIRKLSGEWERLSWGNFTAGGANEIDTITVSGETLKIKLKSCFYSVGYFHAAPNWVLLQNNIMPHAQLGNDGKTIDLNFYNLSTNLPAPLSSIPELGAAMIYIIGGVHFINDQNIY